METLWNLEQDRMIADQVTRCATFGARLCGLLGRSELGDQEVYWIYPATSIHTFFMRMTIDAVFVDQDLKVVKLVRSMTPFQCTWPAAKATGGVIEGSAGWIDRAGINRGTQLAIRNRDPSSGPA